MAIVIVPVVLREYTNKKETLTINGATVGSILSQLAQSYPMLRQHLFSDDGKIRKFVNVYVNSDDIRFLRQEATPIGESDLIHIMPSIAGG
jgi:adenylyltransferase/sulfurtransferase